MPAKYRGPRLWLRPPRRTGRGRATKAVWLILDKRYQESTGCRRDDREGAARALADYINRKHLKEARKGVRDPAQIPVADVLSLYTVDVAPKHGRPKETAAKIERLLDFFGDKMLVEVNGDLCRAFAKARSTPAAAREDLVVLRAAINHHRREGHCEKIVSVVLPEKSGRREVWCTRSQVARLIWTAWRFREVQKGIPTDRRTRRHVARFILVAVYTGTRAGAVCGAALGPTEGRGWIDLDKGIFFRRAAGERESKKRRPPVPLPRRLLTHLRRWKRLGAQFGVEWNGAPVRDCDKAFRNVVNAAGLPDVTPHVLRHTAATWLMQLGTDPWQAAEYLGMSLKTLLENYGHHHPDYLAGPRESLDRAGDRRANTSPIHQRNESCGTVTSLRKIADRY
jgi:integrase